MLSSPYLYGTTLEHLKELPYQEAILSKILLARKLLNILVRDENMEDTMRINEVAKAIEFNKNLLYELGYTITEVSELIKHGEYKMENSFVKDLYVGTRVIKAEPMTRFEYNQFRGWELPADENGADKGFKVVDISSKHTSWLPLEEFNSIYKEASNLSFGSAIEAMKLGNKVARKGWNGKGMFIYYVPENVYPANGNKLGTMNGVFENDLVPYGAYIAMKTAQNNVVPWLASQTDVLSEDWEIVE